MQSIFFASETVFAWIGATCTLALSLALAGWMTSLAISNLITLRNLRDYRRTVLRLQWFAQWIGGEDAKSFDEWVAQREADHQEEREA